MDARNFSIVLAGLGLVVGSCCRQPSGTATADSASSASAFASASIASSSSATTPPSASVIASSSASASIDAGVVECPEDMAKIQRFCIDRWEAHLVVRQPDGSFLPHPHYERPGDTAQYEARSARDAYPQAYISRVESQKACERAGKRLCSLGEWQRGCQGSRWWTYPYGAGKREGRCNSGKPHLLSRMHGADGRAWKYDEHFNDPQLNQQPGFLAKSGEYADCAGPEQVYDMVGNLHEWVRDSVTDELVERLEAEPIERKKQPFRVGNGIFMGGFFSTTSEHGPGCKFITIAHEPSYHDYSTGFRCCKSLPKPPKK